MVFKNLEKKYPFKAILILGPTASGKTSLAHRVFDELSKVKIKASIVNLDAFQLYKGFDIGTAKPNLSDIKKYFYQCLSILEPNENLNAKAYSKLLEESCLHLHKKNTLPICVGGSGLYVRAFLHGLDDLPDRNDRLRQYLRNLSKLCGPAFLHAWLSSVDKKRASEIHRNDMVRIERALEIFIETKNLSQTYYTQSHELKDQDCRFQSFIVHLSPGKEELLERIKKRTQALLDAGWLEEVKSLYTAYGDSLSTFPAMKSIGYREILTLIKDKKDKIDKIDKESLELLIKMTYQYAKKQITWNHKEKQDFQFKSVFCGDEKIECLMTKIYNFL